LGCVLAAILFSFLCSVLHTRLVSFYFASTALFLFLSLSLSFFLCVLEEPAH
jgi:hypothetical protein